jgi:hypothetical protein
VICAQAPERLQAISTHRVLPLHGVQRIAQQIDQHLLYAIGIAPGAQLEIRGLSHDHDAALGNARLHEGQSAIDHLGQFNRLGLAGGLAGKLRNCPVIRPMRSVSSAMRCRLLCTISL